MGFPISLSQEEYEALVSLARQGTLTDEGQVRADEARALNQWLEHIEAGNDIDRDKMWVQWQEAGASIPGAMFPTKWPPEWRYYIELTTRPITKDDVQKVLSERAIQPLNVMVTKDPGAELGWTLFDDYPWR